MKNWPNLSYSRKALEQGPSLQPSLVGSWPTSTEEPPKVCTKLTAYYYSIIIVTYYYSSTIVTYYYSIIIVTSYYSSIKITYYYSSVIVTYYYSIITVTYYYRAVDSVQAESMVHSNVDVDLCRAFLVCVTWSAIGCVNREGLKVTVLSEDVRTLTSELIKLLIKCMVVLLVPGFTVLSRL